MPQIDLPALEAVVTLNPCEAPPPEPVLTTVASVREHQSLYLSSGGGCLYALHAVDGTVRWCQQVKLIRTREVRLPPGMSVPPPHRANFAAPRVVKGANGDGDEVYVVCEYGFGTHTCAFAASDGSLRWWTATDARVSGGHFMDWAAPLVADGIVYSGTYVLNEHDGAVRWRVAAINTWEEGPLALHGLANGTLHATTGWGIYAINAHEVTSAGTSNLGPRAI